MFVGLGESSRRSAPPTVAVAQIVRRRARHGGSRRFTGCWRSTGPIPARSRSAPTAAALFELDATGAEDQTRRLTMTDLDAWHWEDLSLPAGVRFAAVPCHGPDGRAAHGRRPLRAGRPGGQAVGRPLPGPVRRGPGPPNGRSLAVRLGADGTFRVGGDDVLPKDQYLAGAVLSDRQQRRQDLYRQLLEAPAGRAAGRAERAAGLGEADRPALHARSPTRGPSATRCWPSRCGWSVPPPAMRVVIPGPLIPYRRIVDDGSTRPTLEGGRAADMHLRFQLPAAVLPFRVERARLSAKINAPSRRVVIAGQADGAASSSCAPWTARSTPSASTSPTSGLLRLDAEGGLHLNVSLSDPAPARRQGGGRRPGE